MKDCIKEATELIQKLVPGIMELRAGCKITWVGSNVIDYVVDTRDDTVKLSGEDDFNDSVDDIYRNYDILGRDIHLEDVMLAINIKIDSALPDYVCTSGGALLAVDGEFACDTDFSKMISYDLYSPFTEQSEEFYQFIIKTLR